MPHQKQRMQFSDLSPPHSPSLEQQADALQKGLGRAMAWALAGKLADKPLLEACLRDKRYDHQIDQTRGRWLWDILQAAHRRDRFREPILNELQSVRDEFEAYQLVDLGLQFALAGDRAFHQAIETIVRTRAIRDSPWIGENELIALDGLAGLEIVARLHGQELSTRDWEWYDDRAVEKAIEVCGELPVLAMLDQASDPLERRFAEKYRQNQPTTHPAGGATRRRESLQAISAERVIASAAKQFPDFSLRGWGMHAPEFELERVADAIWQATDSRTLANLLRVFSNRAMPRFDPRLIDLCRNQPVDVQRFALSALAMHTNPAVREFAWELFARGNPAHAIRLLHANFIAGDEARMLAAIELPDDVQTRHHLWMELIDLLEAHETADTTKLGVLSYWATPCGNCRFRSVRLLRDRAAAPSWLVEETRHDAEDDCRTLFD